MDAYQWWAKIKPVTCNLPSKHLNEAMLEYPDAAFLTHKEYNDPRKWDRRSGAK
jgi:hypothetical protein